ncbi:MAG: DUF1295 domain-containing protein [Spirochaetaceae bacterium]|nr:DUF1295 domain-containing protein [Spirochaetaceae bacterium]
MKRDIKETDYFPKFIGIVLIAIDYVLATWFGLIIYKFVVYNGSFPWYINFLIADIFATVLIFLFSCLSKNASIYDPYWSVQPIILLACYIFRPEAKFFPPPSNLTIYLFCIICFWGFRLTINWAYTFKDLNTQDWRYTMLKNKTGKFYPFVNFFGIHLVPTLIVYTCTLPALFAAVNSNRQMNVFSFLFGLVSIGAVFLQGIADYQMHKFRKEKSQNPENPDYQFMQRGLWKYSRHPNYLAEILMWWGIALSVVCAMPEYWFSILGAVLNTCLFLFISIPMADKRQSQKEGFEEYKERTRMLLPLRRFK